MEQYKKNLKYIILAMVSACGLIYYLGIGTGDITGLILAVIFYLAYKRVGFAGEKREKIFGTVFAFVFSGIMTLGKLGKNSMSIRDMLNLSRDTVIKDSAITDMEMTGYVTVGDKLMLLVCFLGIFIVTLFLSFRLFHYVDEFQKRKSSDTVLRFQPHVIFFLCFGSMLIMWLPYFVINYPGILSFDSINQVGQATGILELRSNHPPIHTALIGICFKFASFLGQTSNVGVAIYTIIQMLIMAAVESNVIRVVYQYTGKCGICLASWCYFALVPFHAMYSMTMWKDILFAGFTLWMITVIYQIVQERAQVGWGLWIQFIISSILMMLFRNNGRIAYFICIPFFIYGISRNIKRNVGMILIPLVISFVITGPVYSAANVGDSGDIVEALSVPLQHVARVVRDCDDLNDEDIALIEELAPIEEIESTYNCRLSDPMKMLMWSYDSGKVIEASKTDYFMLWLRLGIQHPIKYLLAEIDLTVGYWYPSIQYNTIEYGVYPNDYGIYTRLDTEGNMYQNMCKWTQLYRYIPLYGNLFSIGTMCILMIFVILVNWYCHNHRSNLVILPVAGVLLTLMLATPLFAELRYIYVLMLAMPIILSTMFVGNRSDESEEKGLLSGQKEEMIG